MLNSLFAKASPGKMEPLAIDDEKWIEVEGYKGLTQEMQGYGGFQYELGKTYTTDEEVSLCSDKGISSLKVR